MTQGLGDADARLNTTVPRTDVGRGRDSRRARHHDGLSGHVPGRDPVVDLGKRREDVIADTEVERGAAGDMPVVLGVTARLPAAVVGISGYQRPVDGQDDTLLFQAKICHGVLRQTRRALNAEVVPANGAATELEVVRAMRP